MSLAKAVLSGVIYRKPEIRYTNNDIPVANFTINIDTNEKSLIRVIARGNNARAIEEANLSKDDKVVVDGRLQMTSYQGEDGSEKKIMELDLSGFEVISSSGASSEASSEASPIENKSEEVVKFSEKDMSNDVLIGDEEIPF